MLIFVLIFSYFFLLLLCLGDGVSFGIWPHALATMSLQFFCFCHNGGGDIKCEKNFKNGLVFFRG